MFLNKTKNGECPPSPIQKVRVNSHFINHQQQQKYEKKQMYQWEDIVFP